MSEERTSSCISTGMTYRAALAFALPEILPEHRWILLDTRARMVMLLKLEEPAPVGYSFHLSPSAISVLLALLQASPDLCSYQRLWTALAPDVSIQPVGWEYYVRPIRRALLGLAPVVQACGMEVTALRRRGYLLAPLRKARATRKPHDQREK